MKLPIHVLSLAIAGIFALPATSTAQTYRIVDKRSDAKKSVEQQAASLLMIAKELRAAGRSEVASAVEDQARRLLLGKDTAVTATRKSSRKSPRKATRKGRVWSLDDVTNRRADGTAEPKPQPKPQPKSVAKADPERADVMIVPNGGGDTYRLVPRKEHLPRADHARVDTGREIYRYSPTPTGKDAKGNVTWRGLPGSQKSRIAPAASSLEGRVKQLSAEVQRMRVLLEQLNQQIEDDRKRRLIR